MKLPQPTDDFVWVQAAAGPALECGALPLGVRHVFTTGRWQLGSNGASTDAAWTEVAAHLDVEAPQLARMHQVHGAGVFDATTGPTSAGCPDADIAIADRGGVAVAVQSADCVPLLLVDPRRHAVAAVHAGWRGLAHRAAAVAVEAMVQRFGSARGDLVAAIGPSIGACCYEVGPDVRDAFVRAGYGDLMLARWLHHEPQPTDVNPSMPTLSPTRRSDRWFLDCWAVARDQLSAAGVRRIHIAQLCTASHPDLLCSYRRDGKGTGRMAAAIVLT